MRKVYWVATAFVFIIGILIGATGYIFLGSSFGLGVEQSAEKNNAAKVQVPFYIVSDIQENGTDVGIGKILEEQNNENSLLGNDSVQGAEENSNVIDETQQSELTEMEKERIVGDYKQCLGILFDAWKSKDISSFRIVAAEAYTGDLLEKHVQKAQRYIPTGIGLYVDNIQFDEVSVESGNETLATVTAAYRYTVKDYDLAQSKPTGEEIEHFVQVRADLIRLGSHWYITGETII